LQLHLTTRKTTSLAIQVMCPLEPRGLGPRLDRSRERYCRILANQDISEIEEQHKMKRSGFTLIVLCLKSTKTNKYSAIAAVLQKIGFVDQITTYETSRCQGTQAISLVWLVKICMRNPMETLLLKPSARSTRSAMIFRTQKPDSNHKTPANMLPRTSDVSVSTTINLSNPFFVSHSRQAANATP
jgi:hypothetical protein